MMLECRREVKLSQGVSLFLGGALSFAGGGSLFSSSVYYRLYIEVVNPTRRKSNQEKSEHHR